LHGESLFQKLVAEWQFQNYSSVPEMNLSLKMLIVKRRMSQVAIARKTGISESRLSRIVHGHDEPTAAEKQAIARVLRAKVVDLFPNDAAPHQAVS
jgi:transcriptional regulator with XRE-family HTH domain